MTSGALGQARAIWASVVRANGRARPLALVVMYGATSVLEGAVLLLVLPAAQVLTGGGAYDVPGLHLHLGTAAVVGLMALVLLVRALVTWRSAIDGTSVMLRTADTLRLDALDAILGARWSWVSAQRRSFVVQSLTTQVQRASAAVGLLLDIVVGTASLVVLALVALVISPVVAAVAVLMVGLLVLAVRRDVTRMLGLGEDLSASVERFGGIVTDSLASVRVVRSHDAAGPWLDGLSQEARTGRHATIRVIAGSTRTAVFLTAVGVLGLLGLVDVASRAGVGATHLVALVLTTTRFLATARTLVATTQHFAYLAPALTQIEERTRDARAAREAPTTSAPGPAPSGPPAIEMRGLGFTYPGGPGPALHDLDACLPAGSLTALTGVSGAGKSTLLDLVLGLLTPTEGDLLVDGRPLGDLTAWRKGLAYVPQETVLVPGSVRRNLTWSGVPGVDVTDDDLWWALSLAAVDDVVRRLPDALDTDLLELTQLSGGERQRLSLARALVRRPRLLVLDEATSSLDPALEARVMAGVADLGCTVLIATHRPSIAALASQVLHLEAGRLVEVPLV